ncbi:MAG: hypothetical protein HOE88_04650 [Flavobacteriales bacterium]|jgi:hypothetical protein|nr:hypothetical protein [Flavobacteriales bacterium]MBT3677639.1 hypothetical protein [Flavobacteriales bacterium]MBT3739433.1 hypothetical protein [Flavobacteriales bacterium]MBT4102648.1 hypothetical protein [Flavobacteriales bacterium]MBT4202334.1 hypothetical protein [Flavobacteriales bacterium]
MIKPITFCLAVVALLSISCERTIVPVDNLPFDSTITAVEQSNYVTRLYITLLNRKPSATEAETVLAQLQIDPYDKAIRSAIVANLQSESEATFVLFQSLCNRYLDGVDTAEIRQDRDYYQYKSNNANNQSSQSYYQNLADRMGNLHMVPYWLGWGTVSYDDVQTFIVDNSIYDAINMGTENFCVSLFQNYYMRYPTMVELDEAKAMMNSKAGLLFGLNGDSKSDLLTIFFAQNEYRQGLIQGLFQRYLLRNPSLMEANSHMQQLVNGMTFLQLQNQLLSSHDYVKA